MFRASIIAILLVYLASFSFQNFLSNEHKLNYNAEVQQEGKHDPADFYHFWAGFFNGLGVFKNVTHKKECLSILPVIHDDLYLINDRIKNITDYKDMIEALKFITQKLEHMNQKCEEVKPDCNIFIEEVRKVRDNVKKYLEQEGTKKKIIVHFYQNLGAVIEKWKDVIEHLKSKDPLGAGFALGDLVNYVILWDYKPPEYDPYALHILDDVHHSNRYPF
jgi:hypothetical protein